MIAIVEQVRAGSGAPYKAVCRSLGVPRSSLMRWRAHQRAGQAVVGSPGPSKAGPLDLAALHDDILRLACGRHRTRGTGELYERYRTAISRRDLHVIVEAVRREVLREQEALERRVEWLAPGVVWSMDDTRKHWLADRFGHMHLVMDLGSRYTLRALGTDIQADGERVAQSLEELFQRHGPPLFIKVDGGSNFRHQAVLGLLAASSVIPLVSPPHYPPYNGCVERGHQEVFRQLSTRIGDQTVNPRELHLECQLAGHEVNHMRRDCLGDRTACHTLESARRSGRRYGHRERKEVFEQIKTLAVDIVEQLDQHTHALAETAFRYAAETWMQSNHIIRVTRNGEVLPTFYRFQSH